MQAQGVTVELTNDIAPALSTAFGTTIRLLPGQTEAEELATLVHEYAHLKLGHSERRTTTTKTVRETEGDALFHRCLCTECRAGIEEPVAPTEERTFAQLRKIQHKKEVRTMKYERPEIVLETLAHDAVQARKNNTVIPDGDQPKLSVAAYEADE